MKSKTLVIPIVVATLVGGPVAGVSYAKDHEGDNGKEVTAIAAAKVSLSQAITAAEQATGGKGVDAGIENENGKINFEVTVLKDSTRQKVLVDTITGKVIKTMAADADQEDKDDHDAD